MPVPVPRQSRAVALFLAVLTLGAASVHAKPADFGTATPGPQPGRVAAPARALTTITNAAVCTALYDQLQPNMVPDGGGNGIAFWSDYRSGKLDVFAQKLNAAGVSQWIPDGVPVGKGSGHQYFPQAISDGSGGAIVVWQDGRGDTTYDIYAQRMSPAGVPLWTSTGVLICNAVQEQWTPVLTPDGLGGAVIAWIDNRALGSDVYAQRVNSSGAVQWTANGVAVCTAASVQQDPVIVPDGLQGAIIAWQDQRTSASGDIYARQINGSGVPQGVVDGVVICSATGAQEKPVAVTDGAGGAIVAWTDKRGANYDLYAQRFNGSAALWAANGLAVCAAAGDQKAQAMVIDGAGGAFITWQDNRAGVSNGDIYSQRINASGAAQWTANGIPVCNDAADQQAPTIMRDSDTGVVINWTDARTPATGLDIYGQRLTAAGAILWTSNGVQLCDAPNTQDLPTSVPDGVGGALVVWRDYRSGGYSDLYGQQVGAFGLVYNQCTPPDTLLDSVARTVGLDDQNYYFINNVYLGNPVYYWAGIGVRSDPGGDWDVEFYDQYSANLRPYPTCFGNSLAGSYRAAGVDFVIGDFNDLHTPVGVYGARVMRYATGLTNATVEFDGGPSSIQPANAANPNNLVQSPVGWTGVMDVYDVTMTQGVTYTFQLTHEMQTDVRVMLFSSVSAPSFMYVVPRSARVFESSGPWATFTAPASANYGVVVTNENGVAGSYVLKVWEDNTPTGVGAANRVTALRGLSPNPAPGPATIEFSLKEASEVGFEVIDMAGRVVSKIPVRSWGAGNWSLRWDGKSTEGRPLTAGVYFVQMSVNGQRAGVGRVALIR